MAKEKPLLKKRVSKSRKQRDTQEAQAASQSSALLCSRDEGPWWGQAGRQSEGRVQKLEYLTKHQQEVICIPACDTRQGMQWWKNVWTKKMRMDQTQRGKPRAPARKPQLHTITYNYIQVHTITHNSIQLHRITYARPWLPTLGLWVWLWLRSWLWLAMTGNVFGCDHDDDYSFSYEYCSRNTHNKS